LKDIVGAILTLRDILDRPDGGPAVGGKRDIMRTASYPIFLIK
jgi:hypothetical protein